MMEPMPGTATSDIDLRSVIGILRRQIKTIIATATVILGMAGVFLFAATETYTATALILVDPDSENILSPQQSVSTSAGQDNAQVDSQVEILRSDAVAIEVINEQGLIADPEFGAQVPLGEKLARAVGVANASPIDHDQALAKTLIRFRGATSVRRRGLTYLISVSTTSRSAQQSAVLANSLAQSYIRQQVEAKVSGTLAARNVLQQQMEGSTRDLASYETALDELVDQNFGDQNGADSNPELDRLRAELKAAESRQILQQQREINIRRLLQQEDYAAMGDSLQDDVLKQLGTERDVLLQRMTQPEPTDPPQNLHQMLAELDAQIGAQTSVRLAELGSGIHSIDQEISELRSDLRKEFLAGDLPPELLAGIYTAQQQSTIARTQYQNLLARMHDLETQAQIQIADARIVSPALAPIRASFPNRTLVLLAALAASLVFGVSLAFLKEYYIGGITSTTQLAELLQVPAIATVPQNQDRGAGRLSIADDIIDAPLSVYSESIRKLKASFDQAFRVQNMQNSATGPQGGKTILVTSALENEGKTTTAFALARTFAQAGRKTLLIDADLRRPSLHRQLGFEPQAGFLEYLSGALEPDQSATFYARDTASPLALITGAERSEFPTDQLLCSKRFEALLAQARDVYEIIVIDSSPLLPVVDARYIAHHADAVALVVEWASTSQSDLRNAIIPLRDALQPTTTLVPVLSQMRDLPDSQANAGYYSRYSAAT